MADVQVAYEASGGLEESVGQTGRGVVRIDKGGLRLLPNPIGLIVDLACLVGGLVGAGLLAALVAAVLPVTHCLDSLDSDNPFSLRFVAGMSIGTALWLGSYYILLEVARRAALWKRGQQRFLQLENFNVLSATDDEIELRCQNKALVIRARGKGVRKIRETLASAK